MPGLVTDDNKHDPPPHDENAREPLGPFTPDDETPLGDTPEAHDEITPHDLPKDHPGRPEAERLAGEPGATIRGNVEAPDLKGKAAQVIDKVKDALKRD